MLKDACHLCFVAKILQSSSLNLLFDISASGLGYVNER